MVLQGTQMKETSPLPESLQGSGEKQDTEKKLSQGQLAGWVLRRESRHTLWVLTEVPTDHWKMMEVIVIMTFPYLLHPLL